MKIDYATGEAAKRRRRQVPLWIVVVAAWMMVGIAVKVLPTVGTNKYSTALTSGLLAGGFSLVTIGLPTMVSPPRGVWGLLAWLLTFMVSLALALYFSVLCLAL